MTEPHPQQGDEPKHQPEHLDSESEVSRDDTPEAGRDGELVGDESPAPVDDDESQDTGGSDVKREQAEGKAKAEQVEGEAEEEEGEDEDEEEDDDEDEYEEDESEEDGEEEEPRLKYARLTQYLGPVYRNGDATSAFLVAGDKMIVGTHNGNIHVIQLPTFQTLRVYHAHSASVTAISISPYPPPLPTDKPEAPQRLQAGPATPNRPTSRQSDASPAATSRRAKEPPPLPKIPSNDIYISTASMDGNVCIQSLADMKDVQLRNFARPVQTVALSPEFKSDRTYLSGGLAGQLILTTGGGPGRSTSTTTGTAAAAASGWLGSMGLGTNSGKDTILHSGEGTISCIKWSLSGKYVVWLNEHGIKIMRSNLGLDSADTDDAWKRIGHYDKPESEEWETMAGVWKARVEWVDETALEADDSGQSPTNVASPATDKLREQSVLGKKRIERLIVGWGGTIWIIHVHPGGIGVGKNVGEKTLGSPEIIKILHMDCIISGISLYTQNLLLVLSFCSPDEDEGEEKVSQSPASKKKHKSKSSIASTDSEPTGGVRRRQNNPPPELRLIDLTTQSEVDNYPLSVSRYERLSSSDYHLSVLPARNAASAVASSRGALEALAGIGNDMWHAAINPKSLFSSGASIRSKGSGDDGGSSTKAGSTTGTIRPGQGKTGPLTVHPNLAKPGAKIFIHSPYDCVLGTKRDLGDHLAWLLEQEQYQQAWELLDENPDILTAPAEKSSEAAPSKHQGSVDDFYDDESVAESTHGGIYSSTEKEKRRIGELWVQELIEEGNWATAGQVCGKVTKLPDRWDKWVWTFVGANRFDEITDYIPSEPMHPPLPTTIYEVILGHYIQTDKPRFRELLERWPIDLFDIGTVTTALENQLKYRDVRETSVEDGEKGRDWRIVMESLAKLHEASGRHQEALKCYIKLQDADSAFRLIRDSHLAGAVADDIPSFIGLRVSSGQVDRMTEEDLVEATSEAITLLVDEAQHGLVRPDVVMEQLQEKQLHLYEYFYLKGLWRGEGIKENTGENIDRLVMDSQSLVDDFADLAVHLFATYDRALLMEFLKSSTSYAFEKAVQECELFAYYDELVYLYSKTGQMKRALYLIIDSLKDVEKAIEFAKEQDDPDLWEDLLKYSMDKPSFIRALLEQVGTAINPIKLVRRIPEGLEIKGLREGLTHMMKEHEIQHSISSGVARVLRSEVAGAQNELRSGQRKGIKFKVMDAEDTPKVMPLPEAAEKLEHDHRLPEPGHCAKCHEAFTEYEMETLIAFACGHVFHVSHLLEMLNSKFKLDADTGEANEGRRYMVGMKVMRARLLRDEVRGGCPLCHTKEES